MAKPRKTTIVDASEDVLYRASCNKLTEVEVLDFMPKEFRQGFLRTLGLSTRASSEEGIMELRSAGGTTIANVTRWLFSDETNISYTEIVEDVVEKLNAKRDPSLSVQDLERNIMTQVFDSNVAEMNDDERAKLIKEAEKLAEEFGLSLSGAGKIGAGGAGLVGANAAGFALFTTASSTLAGVGALVGATLPFAAYTAMSSTLAIIIGPVGWIGLGVGAFAWATGPNYKKTIPCVMTIAATRGLLELSAKEELAARLSAVRHGGREPKKKKRSGWFRGLFRRGES